MPKHSYDLTTNIVLKGKTDNSFTQIFDALESRLQTLSEMTAPIREFEEEALQVYRNYEDNMLATEVALGTHYHSATMLKEVMHGLEVATQEWASTTIFHTDDVSAAVLNAARAGWTYEEMLAGIPQAMYIAQAGGMDLAEGLDYLIKMTNATGTEFDDLDTLIDEWAMAANSSATTIDEMGQAFKAMGASAMFGDSTQELFTMLAILADVGTTGSKAGTLLRNTMMRVVAPTKTATEAMEELGYTEEDMEEWAAAFGETEKMLEDIGFSAYDEAGNLKPMLQIFRELAILTDDMDEASRNKLLASIFPTRTISGALAFLDAFKSGKADELFYAIGEAEGYAAQGAEKMMSGLTGAQETLASKWEQFKLEIGQVLAPAVENIAGWLGEIVDWLNSLDETQMSALTGAMTALAELGPVMLGGMGIVSAVRKLGLSGTLMAVAAIGAGALYGYLSKLDELSFESLFGSMELDTNELKGRVGEIDTIFDNSLEAISGWEQGVTEAGNIYRTLTREFSENMLMSVLTGQELSQQEIDAMVAYGDQIGASVLEGIGQAHGRDITLLGALFGDAEGEDAQQAAEAAAVLENWYTELYADAYGIGQELRNQLTAALTDKELDEQERAAIQNTLDRYNQIMAEIQNAMLTEEWYAREYKATRVSWDTFETYMGDLQEMQESDLKEFETKREQTWARLMMAYDSAIANGGGVVEGLNGETLMITDQSVEEMREWFDRSYDRFEQDYRDKYANLVMTALRSLLGDAENTDLFDEYMASFISGEEWNSAYWARLDRQGLLTKENINALGMLFTPRMRNALSPFFADSDFLEAYENAYGHYGAFQTEAFNHQGAAAALEDNKRYVSMLAAQQREIMDAERQHEIEQTEAELVRITGLLAQEQEIYEGFLNGTYEGTEASRVQNVLNISEYEEQIAQIEEKLASLTQKKYTLHVTAELDSSRVDMWTPPSKNIWTGYAEGGRATSPSIFGEAGAEWAIPEEHSMRTAALLDAARAASGFTWSDLISRSGGLGGGDRIVSVNYAPIINAQDSRGVADALAADKARVMRLMRDMMDEDRFVHSINQYA